MDYSKDYYTMPIPFLTSCNITEYDISKANISILLASGLITQEEYNNILKMPRMQRQVYIGKMEARDSNITKALKNGFMKYRKMLIESNGLTDNDILSIKKDAIFVINKTLSILEFDNCIRFVPKNHYTSYFKIRGMEFYYLLDKFNDIENLDVKGIGDKKLLLHAEYMVQFLCIIFEALNDRTPESVMDLIAKFGKKYLNKELELGYYREFNTDSCYRVSANNTQYLLDFALESEKPYLNITENYKLIQELYQIASLLYSSNFRKR